MNDIEQCVILIKLKRENEFMISPWLAKLYMTYPLFTAYLLQHNYSFSFLKKKLTKRRRIKTLLY
jgi:hypothetical protein